MLPIPEGRAWIGSSEGRGNSDERPRFKAHVAPFCLDKTEVTVAAYAACENAGACTPAQRGRVTCTATGDAKPSYPINCVTWTQAAAYCEWKHARLPTEVEWEYAASGGDERTYSWGDEPPDGRTCWKNHRACAVGSFEPGAFGLHDMTGNVWEWTADWYGPYPWPAEQSRHKVYRGGSWSRRFEKWMRVPLRNRWSPKKKGAHLGFRCAKTLPSTECPAGRDPQRDACRRSIDEVECGGRLAWNGARCAQQGEAECPPAHENRPGYGCVLAVDPQPRRTADRTPTEAVRKVRSPEFDADCKLYQPSRPVAWRFEDATHNHRNQVGRQLGCKNRDVGVGWNSACCPQ